MTDTIIEANDFNTQITKELFNSLNQEVREELMEFVSSIDFIKKAISPNIKRAKDLPKDESGKIIIDVTEPHRLEDMDYFRPSALHFMKTGRYTDYKPSKVPNSPFRKWISEERRRCYEGYVRESDGEWITGDYYFFLNYCPMMSQMKDEKAGISVMKMAFPLVMDGQYYFSHYIWQARLHNNNAVCLASRGRGKSAFTGSMLAKRAELGETSEARKFCSSMVVASATKYLDGAETIIGRFTKYLDHVAKNTKWPRRRIRNTTNNLRWEIGYMNNDGTKGGVQNTVVGVTVGDDPGKIRGSRASLFIIEEFGSFGKLKELYENLMPSVKNGDDAYGQMVCVGTAGDKDSDFEGAKELFYNPIGHDIEPLKNVWDKAASGRNTIAFFYPAYLNTRGYYDKDGNSDVLGALIFYLKERHKRKYNSDDPMTLVKYCAENPITPEESMMKTARSYFPVAELNERIKQLENDSSAFDEVEVGELFFKDDGTVDFKHTRELPIRFFPHSDNKIRGAVEIFTRPVKDEITRKPVPGRYIASLDPIDKDSADTMSLSSTFVFDLYTDTIVAEYTGRRDLAVENYEITRMLCYYYNAQCYFENNLLGFKSYMQTKGDLIKYVAQTPNNLKTQGIAPRESVSTGNYGIRTTTPIIDQMNLLIRDWITDEVPAEDENGNEIKVKNLYLVKNIALLKELVLYNDKGNFDRVRSFGLLMIGRDECLMRSGGIVGEKPKYDDYKDDKFISQCISGGNRRYKENVSYEFTPMTRNEINSLLNKDTKMKLYKMV